MKARVSLALSVCFLLFALSFPICAEPGTALYTEQADACEPGQSVTVFLCLPATEIAGGFICVQYDPSLLTLTDVALALQDNTLTMTYAVADGKINILLDGVQNTEVSGKLICLQFATNEDIQPGTYPITCTVPDPASFYALDADGQAHALNVGGCSGQLLITAPVLPPCPARYLACQETIASNNVFYIRLCALVDPAATLGEGTYGFTISITDEKGTREALLQGSSLTDQIDGGGEIYTAEQLGGNIYTATLSLAVSSDLSITVTPYVHLEDQTLYGGTYTVHYSNGQYVNTSY